MNLRLLEEPDQPDDPDPGDQPDYWCDGVLLKPTFYLYVFCMPLIIIMSIISIYIYLRHKQLWKQPGDLIFGIIFFNMTLATHYLVSSLFSVQGFKNLQEPDYGPFCQINGYIAVGSLNFIGLYSFWFCVSLIFKLKQSLKEIYIPTKCYHIVSVVLSSASLIFVYQCDEIGINQEGTCGVRDRILNPNPNYHEHTESNKFFRRLYVLGPAISYIIAGCYTISLLNTININDQRKVIIIRKYKNYLFSNLFLIFASLITACCDYFNWAQSQWTVELLQFISTVIKTLFMIFILILFFQDEYIKNLRRNSGNQSERKISLALTDQFMKERYSQEQSLMDTAKQNHSFIHGLGTYSTGINQTRKQLFRTTDFGQTITEKLKNKKYQKINLGKQMKILQDKTPFGINQLSISNINEKKLSIMSAVLYYESMKKQLLKTVNKENITFKLNNSIFKKALLYIGDSKMQPCTVTFYYPKLFEEIQATSLIQGNLSDSMRIERNQKGLQTKSFSDAAGGKSGNFLFFSKDNNFILKTFDHECKEFLSRINEYHAYMVDNPNSLLTRYYGVFEIKFNQSRETAKFVIMESFKRIPNQYVQKTYDCKGSTLKREVMTKKSTGMKIKNKVLKDLDFKKIEQTLKIQDDIKIPLIKQIEKDVQFLSSAHWIDYSLIIFYYNLSKMQIFKRQEYQTNHPFQSLPLEETYEHKQSSSHSLSRDFLSHKSSAISVQSVYNSTQCVNIGIIDFPEVFSLNKKGERIFKKVMHPSQDPSSAGSRTYAKRFMEFVKEIIPMDNFSGITNEKVNELFNRETHGTNQPALSSQGQDTMIYHTNKSIKFHDNTTHTQGSIKYVPLVQSIIFEDNQEVSKEHEVVENIETFEIEDSDSSSSVEINLVNNGDQNDQMNQNSEIQYHANQMIENIQQESLNNNNDFTRNANYIVSINNIPTNIQIQKEENQLQKEDNQNSLYKQKDI